MQRKKIVRPEEHSSSKKSEKGKNATKKDCIDNFNKEENGKGMIGREITIEPVLCRLEMEGGSIWIVLVYLGVEFFNLGNT
jgi:hypothetical protein